MTFLTSYLAEEDFDASVEEQMAYSKFTYRCDAAYLGQKGVLALLPVFAVDASFTHLVLRGCGVHNDGIGKVCESLLGHPTLSYLYIGDVRFQGAVHGGGSKKVREEFRRRRRQRRGSLSGIRNGSGSSG